MAKKESAEKAVRDIRRKTRRRFSAEEKIRIVIEGLRGQGERLPDSEAAPVEDGDQCAVPDAGGGLGRARAQQATDLLFGQDLRGVAAGRRGGGRRRDPLGPHGLGWRRRNPCAIESSPHSDSAFSWP